MAATEIHGYCQCGAVTYTATAEPKWSAHCHCKDCRRQTASAVATFVCFEQNHFSLNSGEFKAYESSPGVRRSFCPDCGTPMAYETDKLPGEIHLLIGTLDKPEDFPPQLQVFCREQLPWLKASFESPGFEGLPDEESG